MKYILINKGEEKPFQKLLLNWYTGIDAIEIADGNFIIDEKAFLGLSKYSDKTVSIDEKDVNLISSLEKYPILDEKDIVFKIEVIEKEIIGK